MKVIKSADCYGADTGSMKSKFLFSFGEYVDTSNTNLGHVRVFNDDVIKPNGGLPMHPHNYYEVMTIMLDGGKLTHEDNFGNSEVLSKNQIQVTNTGSGIEHSEMNKSNKNVKLYQLWFAPGKVVPKPTYYTAKFKPKDLKNNLHMLASGIEGIEAENKLISPVAVYRGIFDEGESVTVPYEKHILLYVTSGEVSVGGRVIEKKDQLRDSMGGKITIDFTKSSEILVLEIL